jgi:histone acetyltransferase
MIKLIWFQITVCNIKYLRSYLSRLVFDKRHVSLARLSDNPALRESDDEVIGVLYYPPFHEMRFAEIAFCADNANRQVKVYGSKLMNH